ncbi:MAG: peptidoglycan-N-acetylglucosamine deacetylase [Eubacteriales bacterium]|nr:peptidoglycan-N-acetylglucosamine deacetylase [Eubacteriales bacterium]
MWVFFLSRRWLTTLLLAAVFLTLFFALLPSSGERFGVQPAGSTLVTRVESKEKLVALTFDDGPDPVSTREILPLLARYRVKATFFLVGYRVRQYPDLAAEIARQGHQIENHSMTHPPLSGLRRQDIESQIKTSAFHIQEATGRRTRYFRPPDGEIGPAVEEAARRSGHKLVGYSLTAATIPYQGILPPGKQWTEIIPPGSIIRLRDREDCREETLRCLHFLLEVLTREGYRFMTIDQLMAAGEKEAKKKQ